MNQITATQRALNIITKAVANGFEIDETDTFEQVMIDASQFLIDNEIDVIEEKVEVKSLGNHGQRVDWSDGKGFDFWSQGEIADMKPGKAYHTTVVDSEANVVKMYCIVD